MSLKELYSHSLPTVMVAALHHVTAQAIEHIQNTRAT
jgi:hypothetical protein